MINLRTTVPALLVVGALALSPVAVAAPAPTYAPLQLFTPQKSARVIVHAYTWTDDQGVEHHEEYTELSTSLYVKSPTTRFEIDVRRADVQHDLTAVATIGGHQYKIPSSLLDGWNGLKNAFEITWTDPEGTVLSKTGANWCPNDGGGSRLTPGAAGETVFAYGCGSNPFTRGQRWGIDRGWARQVLTQSLPTPESLPAKAVLQVAVRPALAKALHLRTSDARVTLPVTVTHVDDDNGGDGPTPGPVDQVAARSQHRPPATRGTAQPAKRYPADVLPDLIALPAWGMSTHTEDGRDLLDFAATVYNGGQGPLVAEGFRRGTTLKMNAYQFFYRGKKQVGSAAVGGMEFDERPSHQHWHFEDFATYDLVNKAHVRLRTSGKEAFCLAPTDAIDLLQKGAVVNPGNGDLSTACGDESSIWVREVLAQGWGDTYTQQRAGQSIDITGLANGTFWVRVTANPGNRLQEASRKNNTALRKVILGGTPGARTVKIPRYGVIDSEAGLQVPGEGQAAG
ncbi:MAG: protein-lysine 6-oxidase [Marmoricola sp.]|nr:protein-lysine 6-oxidase [Marmoricola sp.]